MFYIQLTVKREKIKKKNVEYFRRFLLKVEYFSTHNNYTHKRNLNVKVWENPEKINLFKHNQRSHYTSLQQRNFEMYLQLIVIYCKSGRLRE